MKDVWNNRIFTLRDKNEILMELKECQKSLKIQMEQNNFEKKKIAC